jgi:regulatory protein
MIIQAVEVVPRKKGYLRITAQWEDEEKNLPPEVWSDLVDDPDFPEFFVSDEVVYRRNIRKGLVISLKEMTQLIYEDDLVKARDYGLFLLNYKMRTEKEIEDKLKEKNFSDEVIQKTVERLIDYGFIDDEKYAELYLKQRIAQRGARTIEHELAKKGVSREIANELLDELGDEEESAALEACKKKVRNLRGRGLEEGRVKEKTYRFLLSRGYDYNLIKKVYNLTLEELDYEEEV